MKVSAVRYLVKIINNYYKMSEREEIIICQNISEMYPGEFSSEKADDHVLCPVCKYGYDKEDFDSHFEVCKMSVLLKKLRKVKKKQSKIVQEKAKKKNFKS